MSGSALDMWILAVVNEGQIVKNGRGMLRFAQPYADAQIYRTFERMVLTSSSLLERYMTPGCRLAAASTHTKA